MQEDTDELERAQSNLQPHYLIRNGASVDGFLWKGRAHPTRVQRAFVITGLMIGLTVLGIMTSAPNGFRLIPILIGGAFLAVGLKVASNAFGRRSN